MSITCGLLALTYWLGRWQKEWSQHLATLQRIPLRIHVGGTRGKSTVTRLIAAGLRQRGLTTVAKTTGSATRFIFPDGTEKPWPRQGKPNISEQLEVIAAAAALGAEALVLECMALQKDITAAADRIFPASLSVITNVRPDHTDIYPCLDRYAEAMAEITPVGGWLVTSPGPYVDLFFSYAANRGSQLVVAETDASAAGLGLTLDHHPENVGLALAALELMGVDRHIALAGIADAAPDPGAFALYRYTGPDGDIYFANIFAANDPVSTWERLNSLLPTPSGITSVALYNHRPDRLQRARDFHPVLAELQEAGSTVYSVGPAKPPFSGVEHLGNLDPGTLISELGTGSMLILGLGNIGGLGYELNEYFMARGMKLCRPPW